MYFRPILSEWAFSFPSTLAFYAKGGYMSDNNNQNTNSKTENNASAENKSKPAFNRRKTTDVKRLVGMAMFASLAIILGFATSSVKVAHLTFDAKDAVITLSAFVYGPVSAVAISFIVAFIESVFITFTHTFWHGLLMDFVSSAVFSLTATLIYKKKRSFNGAIIGFAFSTVITTAAMLGLNILITPLYMKQLGVPMSAGDVIAMIPKLLLPFNFAKALMNSAIAMVLYKPVSQAMRKAGFAKGDVVGLKFNKKSLILVIICLVAMIAAVTIFIVTSALNS
jgi:riboflavin transporter FmnP